MSVRRGDCLCIDSQLENIQLNYLASHQLSHTLHCKHCTHLFMEHDDHGCRHSACSCRVSQRKMVLNGPDPSQSQADDYGIFDIKVWLFTREYQNITPDSLFNAISKSMQDVSVFKVWKVDNNEKYINLTTHSIRLDPTVKYHQVEVDLQIKEGRTPYSSVVNFRIIPTLTGALSRYEVFTNIDVNDKFANHVADLIFGAIEEGSR